MKISVLVGFSALVLFIMAGTAGAAPLPGEFYGTVTIDGSPAPAGTQVTAWIANHECGSLQLVREGVYGQGPDTLDPSFTVSCPEARENDRVRFSINGHMAAESRDFTPAGRVRLDLSVDHLLHIPPVVNFTAEPVSGNAPLAVRFTDATESSPRSWVWNFGDTSAPSFVRDPVHTFSEPGVYDIGLMAVNATGMSYIEKEDFVSVFPAGDINHNWRVDIDDVLTMQNISAGTLAPEPGADLNHDGTVNDADLALIMYYYTRK
jgi:PKD repeat protein